MTSPGGDPIRVLLIEDDARLAQLVATYLRQNGLSVEIAGDGARGLDLARRIQPDLILLDLMLPDRNGFDVCRDLRSRHAMPIIVLTARGDEADRVVGLELGADDYMAKPFSSRELLARIRAQVRRARGQAGPGEAPLRVGALRLDPQTQEATLAGARLDLSTAEFALLEALMRNAGRILTRERLLDLSFSPLDEAFDRAVDVRVSRLRAKLGDDPRQPRWLKTVRGRGYMLVNPDAG